MQPIDEPFYWISREASCTRKIASLVVTKLGLEFLGRQLPKASQLFGFA